MKKVFSVVVAMALLVSCSDYDPGLSEQAIDYTDVEQGLILAYEEEFVERYGAIDEGHTWGFGEKGSEDASAEEHTWYRVMCENLGAVEDLDFDFNDVVFDVYYTGTAPDYEAHICLQAAGCDESVYIGENGNLAYEVHQLLGQEPQTKGLYHPVNVGGVEADPKDLVLHVSSTDPNDIPVFVSGVDASGRKGATPLPAAGASRLSAAPQKICIPGNDTRWLHDGKQITEGYPFFSEWVKEESGDYGFRGLTPWNKANVKEDFLWKKK